MKRAAFLDRDGVINQKAKEGEYITRWLDMRIMPGVPEAISLLNKAGFEVIVVTNQRCVSKGIISIAGLERLHKEMCATLEKVRAHVSAVYYCPHEVSVGCDCRKPQPGMLLRAANEHYLDLASSWMIGDSDSDAAAGMRAKCRTAMVSEKASMTADITASSLLEVVKKILAWELKPIAVDHAQRIQSGSRI